MILTVLNRIDENIAKIGLKNALLNFLVLNTLAVGVIHYIRINV